MKVNKHNIVTFAAGLLCMAVMLPNLPAQRRVTPRSNRAEINRNVPAAYGSIRQNQVPRAAAQTPRYAQPAYAVRAPAPQMAAPQASYSASVRQGSRYGGRIQQLPTDSGAASRNKAAALGVANQRQTEEQRKKAALLRATGQEEPDESDTSDRRLGSRRDEDQDTGRFGRRDETSPESESIKVVGQGNLDLYGNGQYQIKMRGNFVIDDKSQVTFTRDNRNMSKQRQGDYWIYQNVDDMLTVNGSEIALRMTGYIDNFQGSGSGTLNLTGQGSYSTSSESGRIPPTGISIEFGRTSATYK